MRRPSHAYAAGAVLLAVASLGAGLLIAQARPLREKAPGLLQAAGEQGGHRQLGGIALVSLWLHTARVRAVRRRCEDSRGRGLGLNMNG